MKVCPSVLMAGVMAGAGACPSSICCTGSCQALSAFPAPREGSSLLHRHGQDRQSPEVSGAAVAGPWMGTHPCTATHTTDPGGHGDLTLLLPAGSCRHRPSPPVGRGTGLAGRADLSCHRHTMDGANIRDLAPSGGTTTALGDMDLGLQGLRKARHRRLDGWTDRQSSPACMALTVYFCLAEAVLLVAPGIPSGALCGLGAVQPVLGDGAGIARPHQVHALGAQVDTVVLVWGKGTWLSGLSPARGSCQPTLPAPSHCIPEPWDTTERQKPSSCLSSPGPASFPDPARPDSPPTKK